MRKVYALLFALLFALPLALWAQRTVQLAGLRFVPDQNARNVRRGVPDVGPATGGQHNVLVQFAQIPTAADIAALARQGLTLGDYVGGNAYFALLREGGRPPMRVRGGAELTSLVPMRPEWKMGLGMAEGDIPAHARAGEGVARISVFYAGNANEQLVSQQLRAAGCRRVNVQPSFQIAQVELPVAAMGSVATLPWVLRMEFAEPPRSLNNYQGRTLGRANVLNTPVALHGRGLYGKGSRVGIWDGNVMTHPDFGDRVHTQEYELGDGNEAHGTHVAGTVLGAGMLDPNGRGMAPKAQAWTYNFNEQANGKSAEEEMQDAAQRFGITLTQNSYGYNLSQLCAYYRRFVYFSSDYRLDRLAVDFPTLTHVFAGGNERAGCRDATIEMWGAPGYGTGTLRAKNVINVAAVNAKGELTNFSSMGPQSDGRLFPTVAATGDNVYSVQPPDGYQRMSGTSMACPTATGHLALLQERYRQLHSGANIRGDVLRAIVANTADDAGRRGPDFQYGYGILNAEKAVVSIEQQYFHTASLQAGETAIETINIPAGCTGLRVMLVWNDPPVARAYGFEERVMTNDLDLHLKVNGKEYLPWVLKAAKGHVEDLPTRQVDVLNNIEQVTLSAAELGGATSVEFVVTGKEVVNGKQEYAVAYWFESDDLRLTYPSAGELLEAGGKYLARIDGARGAFTLEISYDGGNTYAAVARDDAGEAASTVSVPFALPADAPLTSRAVMRIVGQDGRAVSSQGLFTIAPRPKGLKLTTASCGYDGWSLEWEKHDGATMGYEVLLGDALTGEWISLGHTENAAATRFDVSGEAKDKVSKAKRPIFAVAARVGDKEWGKRSVGVEASVIRANSPSLKELPIEETFASIPSQLFRIKTGANVKARYRATMVGNVPLGSNFFGLVVNKGLKDFNTNDYFDESKNAPNMAELEFCELQLGDVENVVLHITGNLDLGTTETQHTACMRVLDGNQVLKSSLGTEVQKYRGRDEEWYFPLEANKVHKLRIQFSGYDRNDLLALVRVAIEQAPTHQNVTLSLLDSIKGGAALGTVPVRLLVNNASLKPAKGVELRAYVNGKWQTAHAVKEIPAFGDATVTMQVDLSTPNPLGQLMDLRFEAVLAGDVDTANNVVRTQVNNMGTVVPMGTSVIVATPWGEFIENPFITHEVTKPLVFTDNGGYLGNHSIRQQSTIKFVPPDPSMRVRARFVRLALASEAYMGLYTGDVPKNLNVEKLIPRALFSSTSKTLPTYVSEAEDGGLAFHFESQYESAEGWAIEIDLVPAKNPLTVVSARAEMMGITPQGSVPVVATVRNNWSTAQENVNLYLISGNRVLLRERVARLEPGVSEVQFTEKLTMGLASNALYTVRLTGDDYDASDNSVELLAAYDSYCLPKTIASPKKLTLGELRFEGATIAMPEANGRMQYNLDRRANVWQKDGSVRVQAGFKDEVPDGKFKLTIWVDWNGNFQFEETEKVEASMVSGAKRVELTLPVPADLEAGPRRARILLCASDAMTDGPCVPKMLEYGDVRDITLMLNANADPKRGDLGVTKLDAGLSGKDLPSDRELKLTLVNNSYTEFAGKVAVKVQVDDKPAGEEMLDCAGSPLVPYGGTHEFTLTTRVDLSAAGNHVVTATIAEQPAVVTPENNEVSAEVYCVKETPNGFYALQLKTQANSSRTDYVDVQQVSGLLAGIVDDDEPRCIEMLVNIDRPQLGLLMEAEGFRVLSLKGEDDYPDNSIGVAVGDWMELVTTTKAVLTPGVWHHIAIMIPEIQENFEGSRTLVDIYVDGQKQQVLTQGGTRPSFEHLRLGSRFDGKINVFRIWKGERTEADIRSQMYQYVRKADGSLPAGCLAEFAFNEGPANLVALSGSLSATMRLSDPSLAEKTDGTGLWYPLAADDLIASVEFDGQKGTSRKSGQHAWEATFPLRAELGRVKGRIVPAWSGASITYKSQPVTADSEFDLTKDVELVAELKGVLGHDFAETASVAAKRDLDEANELKSLSMEMAKNEGLVQDLKIDPVQPHMSVAINATTGLLKDVQRVVLSFTVSDNAKLYAGDTELTSGETAVDLSRPVQLTVVAQNGDRRQYTLRLAYEQRIEWELAANSYVYGDQPVAFTAKATSGLPISYESTNPASVSTAKGMLHVGTPGEARIIARQDGGGHFAAATPVEHAITVKKRGVTVTVDQQAMYGVPVDLKYTYATLVNAEDAAAMPDPMAKGAFKLMRGGKEYSLTDILPVGSYTLEAQAAYETELYEVQPVSGKLEIKHGALRSVTFSVKDESMTPIVGASLQVDGRVIKTRAGGTVSLPLRAGTEYSLRVTMPGYSPSSSTFDVPADTDALVEVILRKATLVLTYSSAGNGTVHGESPQHVAPGRDGMPVLAIADDGYLFDSWSDGRKDNPRIDKKVSEAITVQAKFVIQSYTLEYVIGDGGKQKGGTPADLNQTVKAKEDGVPVEVEPMDGYYFIGWSDGRTELRRQEKNVLTNMRLEARFGRFVPIPNRMPFEDGVFSDGWYSLSKGPADFPFVVSNAPLSEDRPGAEVWNLDGYFAVCNVDKHGKAGQKVHSMLYSPRYSLNGVNKAVVLSFDYLYCKLSSQLVTSFKVFYSVDGTNWEELGDLASQDHPKRTTAQLEVDVAKLQGKQFVQFAWEYKAGWDRFVMLDNVNVFQKLDVKHTITYLADPVEGGLFTVDGVERPLQQVVNGQMAKPVTAVPKEEYTFVRWRETGSTDPTFQQPGPVIASQTYVAEFHSKASVIISYTSIPAGAGTFMLNGAVVNSQEVKKGENSKAVIAKPTPGYVFDSWVDNGSRNPERVVPHVAEHMTLTANFTLAEYTVAFVVLADGAPVSGASVTCGAKLGNTDANGRVEFRLPAAEYKYSVTANGFEPSDGRLQVDGAKSVTIDLKEGSVASENGITFAVTGSGAHLPGAQVAIKGQDLVTGADGRAAISLPDGTYDYAVKCDGYQPGNGSVTLAGSPVIENVALVPVKHQITITPPEHGQLKVTNAAGEDLPTGTKVDHGATIAIEIIPDAGYSLVRLEIGSEVITPMVPQVQYVRQVMGDVTISAVYESVHGLTIDAVPNGAFIVSEGSTQLASGAKVARGAKLSVTVMPARKHRLEALKVNDVERTAEVVDNVLTHTVDGDTHIGGSFKRMWEISYMKPLWGTLAVLYQGKEVASGSLVNMGEPITIRVAPEDPMKYRLVELTLNGQNRTDELKDGELTMTPTGDTEIAARFEQIRHTVTFEAPSHGSLQVKANGRVLSSGETVDHGTELIISAEPTEPDQYALAQLLMNGEDKVASVQNGELRYIVQSATTIVARFAQLRKVEYAQPDNGMLSVQAHGRDVLTGARVPEGTELTITATPKAGYTLKMLSVNGTDKMADVVDGVLRLALSEDVVLAAAFVPAPKQFAVHYEAPAHGTLTVQAGGTTVANGDKVDQGTELTITAKADAGYRLSRLTVDGKDRTADAVNGTLKITVEAEVSIAAQFAEIDASTAVGEGTLAGIVVYPNPFVEIVHLEQLSGVERIRVLDAAGVVLRTIMANGATKLELQLGDLPEGSYVLVVESAAGHRAIRLVKER